jgi:enoyl-CoA hydratase/carnithine racemase
VIEVVDEGAVRRIAFDRPEVRNAFDLAMYKAVTSALEAAAADGSVHAVVLTGNGAAFSSGQDLREMARIAAGDAPPGVGEGFGGLLDVLATCPTPVLAAVNGAAIGLGFTMLAHCDLVLIDDAARLRAPFAELGVPPEAASSVLFPMVLGRQKAAEVLLAATWLDARQAVECGIALRACRAGTVVAQTMELAGRIAAFDPRAVQEIKRLMRAGSADAVARARAREEEAFARAFGLAGPAVRA